jgi:thiamine pyrophosphate-dependent acetolactate synthase large subunit-like protein
MTALNRREAVAALLQDRGDLIVIAGLGSPAYDVAACGDTPLDFPSWGGMGGAAMVGLGVALGQPGRNVLVVTGDGEMLMGLGSLATIGAQRPSNLSIVVLDNEIYGETGRQQTHTGLGVDLPGVARACGFDARTITDAADLQALRYAIHAANGPLFAVLKVSSDEVPRVMPPRNGAYLTHRTREALLGLEAAVEA